MRFLSKREVRQLVLYSFAHVARLEAQGRFPKRVRLGNGPRGRVGYLESEILEWMRQRIDARDEPTRS
jgi:prophage regulatory protein